MSRVIYQRADRTPPKAHSITRKYAFLERSILGLANELRRDVIIPFCDKKNLKFMAGMGTWIFVNEDNVILAESDIPKRVLRLLDGFPVPGTNGLSLATQCIDYVPKGFVLKQAGLTR